MTPAHSQNTSGQATAGEADGSRNRMLRVDAAHNRERILAAAHELFSREGIDVPLAKIARQAGVGVATLYRRFPTRVDLVSAAFVQQRHRCIEVLNASLADPDPWRGICTLVRTVCTMQAIDRGFNKALASQLPHIKNDDRGDYLFALESMDRLVAAAHRHERLRTGVTGHDIVLILLANSGVVGSDPRSSLAASRRLVAHLLTAIGSSGAPRPLPADEVDLDDLVRERLS